MKNTTNWVVKYNCWLLISPFLLIKSIKIHSSACFTPDFLSKNFQSLAWSHGVNVPHHQPQHPSTIPMGPSEPRHFSRCTLPSFSDLDSQVPIHFSVTRPPSKGTGYLHGDGGMEGWKKDEKKQMKPSKKWVTLLKAIKYDEGSLKFFSSWKTRKKSWQAKQMLYSSKISRIRWRRASSPRYQWSLLPGPAGRPTVREPSSPIDSWRFNGLISGKFSINRKPVVVLC